MPILYIHGVSVRDEAGWEQVETLLRRYIAPEIASDPENVAIKYCFWGDQAAKLSWLGSSIPATPGTEALHRSTERLKRGRAKLAAARAKLKNPRFLPRDEEGKISIEFTPKLKRLRSLSKDRLSNFLTASIQQSDRMSPKERAMLAAAADEIVNSEEVAAELENCENVDQEVAVLESRLKLRYESLRHGIKDKLAHRNTWAQSVGSHLKEGVTRGIFSPSFAATRVVMSVKAPLAQFVTRFLGDVFTYLHKRGDAAHPGGIPRCVIDSLIECRTNQKKRDGEPIVVLSHSMGGQIMYDVVTHFLPEMPELEDIRIDFWCASASQVGFFEELKLFICSSSDFGANTSKLVPHPDRKHLGYWWNVWDHNDFVSYSVKGVIEEVDDEAYNTGMDIVQAHVGYLVLPSFYRKFATKLKHSLANDPYKQTPHP
jgi:hypothetical protein